MKLNILFAGLGLALAASAAAADEAKPEMKMERRVMVMGDHAKADADGDGEVSRDEFMAMHADMFARLDTDKNGKLSKAEREAAHAGRMKLLHGGEHGAMAMGAHGPGEKRVHMIELRHGGDGHGPMDANKDGKISPDEFAAPLKKAFEAMDADKSGFLEAGERAKGPMRFEHRVEKKVGTK